MVDNNVKDGKGSIELRMGEGERMKSTRYNEIFTHLMGRGAGEGGKKHCPLIIKNRFKRKRTKFNQVAYTPPEFATNGDGIV